MSELRAVLVDNFDSFTFNLADLFRQAARLVEVDLCLDVVRPDHTTVAQLTRRGYAAAILSPGPGAPEQAGLCLELVRAWRGKKPMFGVCLGHQVVAVALGGRVVQAHPPVHGKVFAVHHSGQGCLRGLPQPLLAMRYHSLHVDEGALPAALEVTARLADGSVMALREAATGLESVQFHPESIGTPDGLQLARNVLQDWQSFVPQR